MVEDAGRGYRKVVPSPKPIDVVPKWVIRDLVHAGRVVIAAGRRRHPRHHQRPGALRGRRGRHRQGLRRQPARPRGRVDLFIILTAIERVYIDFGKPGQREAPVLTVEEAKKHLADGQFPPGSMGPKIRAAVEYIEAGGREVLITTDPHLKAALLNRSGTRIVADA